MVFIQNAVFLLYKREEVAYLDKGHKWVQLKVC
jgi:hypothetical protein